MRRVLGGIALGLLLVYPGTEFVRFLFTNLTRVYREVSLTDCLLILLILLLCVQLLQRTGGRRLEEPELRLVSRQPRQPRARSERTWPEHREPAMRGTRQASTSRTNTDRGRDRERRSRRSARRERL